MKQSSLANFWKKKEEIGQDKNVSKPKSPMKQKSPVNSPQKISTPKKSQAKEKIKESPKSKNSSAKKSAILEDEKTSKKRRHIVDDEDEEWSAGHEDEQATDMLLPDKKSKMEKSETKLNEISSEKKSNVHNIQIENKFKNISIVNKKDSKDGILFDSLVQALSKIEVTKGEGSKDIMKETLSELFKTIIINSPDDLSRVFYFLLSKVGPEYRTPEFGIGTGILEKVVAKAIGKSDKHIKERMVQLGDLALVASEGKKTLGTMDSFKGFGNSEKQKKELSLKQVMDTFTDLANIKGKSSMAEKEKLIIKLLFSANKDEIKYIVRSLQKGLKIGANFKTINAALARAICKIYNETSSSKASPKKSAKKQFDEKEVEKTMLIAINNISDEDIVLQNVIDIVKSQIDFNELINLCKITPGIPVKPQLARPTTGVKVVFERFEGVPFTCEYKYDGFRGQVHHYPAQGGHKTEIFSRNLENMSESYPDIIQYIDSIHSEKAHSFILDCEIVAFDPKTGKILPFHNLTTRARKNVSVKEISTQVCMFLFDILYFNGKSVCELTLDERRNLMKENFEENPNIQLAKYVNSDKLEEIQEFMNESITAGTEGLIIKALYKNSEYQPGQRNFNWLKLKKDYLETSIGDSLDLVPIGAEYGKGKRKGFYGTFLLACYDEDTEKFQPVTMIGTGLKDDEMEKFYNELSKTIIDNPRSDYEIGNLSVDVWFDANMVWEVKTADLSGSPIYSAAKNLTADGRGISLRFPRFIRIRPDKKPEEATTSEEIFKMFKDQEKNTKKINFAEDEYYD